MNASSVRRVLLVIVLASLAATACRDPLGPIADELAEARARWSATGLEDYDFEFERICYCGAPIPEPVVVSVRSGAVVGARSMITDEESPAAELPFYFTIEELFERLQDAIRRKAHEITAEYDPEHGYPTSVFIDYEEMAADEEFGWEARDLRADGPWPGPRGTMY